MVLDMRAEFAQILLASTIFQNGLEVVREIAKQVHEHSPTPAPSDPHSFRFGHQWNFADTDDNRFIPASVVDIVKHLEWATHLELPELTDTRFMGLAASTMAAVKFTAAKGTEIIDWRANTLATLSDLSTALRPLSAHLLATFAPGHIICHHKPNSNIALIELVTQALGLSDSDLAFHLCVGMPAIGTIPSTGNWRQKVCEGREPFASDENHQWNIGLEQELASTPRSAAESDPEYWDSIISEIDAGTCDGFATFADMNDRFGGEGSWRAIRAFPVLQKGKYRRCDDAKASLHNSAASMVETITTIMADWPVRAAAAFAAELGFNSHPWQVLASTDDMYKAYRMAPCSQPQFTVTAIRLPEHVHAALQEREGKSSSPVRYLTMAGFNFGLKAAVPMFNRIPFFSTEFMRRCLGGVCDHYFDDIVTTEPSWATAPCPISPIFPNGVNNVQACLWCVHAMIGFPLAIAKKSKFAAIVTFLGVISDFTRWGEHGEAEIYTSEARKDIVAEILKRALDSEKLSRRECESLTGKIGFMFLWSAGRFGRAVLRPLYDYVTNQDGAAANSWSAALNYALLALLAIISKLPRSIFRFRTSPRPTVKIWTDACWEEGKAKPAGLGIVLYFPAYTDSSGKAHAAYYMHAAGYASKEVLEKFVKRKQYIGQLELYAALLAYTTFKDELRGRRAIHWIDNTSALASLIKGYSRVPDSAQIVHAFHSLALGLKCKVWIEYVNTKANIADEPSREEFKLLESLGSTAKAIVFPELPAFDDDAAAWLCAGQATSAQARHRAGTAGEHSRPRRRKRGASQHHAP